MNQQDSAYRCSDAARVRADPLAGSAPPARRWLLLEHPGPWRIDAIPGAGVESEVLSRLLREAAIFERDVPLYGLDLREDAQLALLRDLAAFYPEQPWASDRRAGLRYRFDNPNFARSPAGANRPTGTASVDPDRS